MMGNFESQGAESGVVIIGGDETIGAETTVIGVDATIGGVNIDGDVALADDSVVGSDRSPSS